MLNQAVLVGRLTKDLEVKEMENGKKISSITLAVSRCFKNENGEYDTDFVDVVLWNSIAESTAQYCKKGDIVGIKGRIQTRDVEFEDGSQRKVIEIIAEKITFLSNKKSDEE